MFHHQPLPEPVPKEQDVHADHDGYQRDHVKRDGIVSVTAATRPDYLLRRRMSAFGTKRTSRMRDLMSAFGGKADITQKCVNVRL
jgi:hypothetical protein